MADIVTAGSPYIGGELVNGKGRPFDVEDPATGESFATVEAASLEQFEAAIAAARHAFDGGPWPRMGMDDRVAMIGSFYDALERQREALIETLIAEAGCPRRMSESTQYGLAMEELRELPALAQSLPTWEHNELPLDRHLVGSDLLMSIRRYEPVGVVAAITPYNFPLICALRKVASALAVGNVVVLRPSPLTPLATLALGAAADEAGLPPGVLSVVVDAGPEGGQCLSSHPDVDLVSFTGSVTVGRAIAAQGAATLKRMVLELGGKSVQLYLPDVLEGSVAAVVARATAVFRAHAGQGCVLQTRVLVPKDRRAEVLDALGAAADRLVVGEPRDPATEVGPVISRGHRDGIQALVTASVDAGGRLVAGGRVPEDRPTGWYYAPTVVDIDDNSNPLAQTEAFGPVLTVQGYHDVDEAVAIANDSEYGLSGGVYTGELHAGMAVAERIQAGAVHVNTGGGGSFAALGGYKRSGIGHEKGVLGIRALQLSKHVTVASR
jgi:acyl-CoA reductase-like NAD-dependent aldehyde dehydrogenase